MSVSGEWSNVGRDASVRTWDLAARTELKERRIVRTDGALLSVDARPDGRLVVGDVNGRVFVVAGQ